jgi:hypothetical protein
VTSGAFLPNNQELSNGVVHIQVVEGQLERFDISLGYISDQSLIVEPDFKDLGIFNGFQAIAILNTN